MQSRAFLVTSGFSWFISFITLSLALRSVTMIRPAGWYWMNCERSKQATARALGSLDVSKIVMRTLKICNKRSYIRVFFFFNFFFYNKQMEFTNLVITMKHCRSERTIIKQNPNSEIVIRTQAFPNNIH